MSVRLSVCCEPGSRFLRPSFPSCYLLVATPALQITDKSEAAAYWASSPKRLQLYEPVPRRGTGWYPDSLEGTRSEKVIDIS